MVTSKRKVQFILGIGVLALISVVFIYVFSYKITPQYAASPVDQWFGIGFERSKLEDDYENETISDAEYQQSLRRLVAQETRIAKAYPRNMVEYRAYTQDKSNDEKHPIEFWIAILTAIVAGLGSLSGMVLAWKSDRRAAIETELKVLELQRKVEESTGA